MWCGLGVVLRCGWREGKDEGKAKRCESGYEQGVGRKGSVGGSKAV